MINVIGAIITNDAGDIFIAQRPKDKSFADLWEFPGGKQDEGETLEQALKRELIEEFNAPIEINNFFMKSNFSVNDKDCCLHLYYAKFTDESKIELLEHQAYKWVKPQNLKDFNYPPADLEAIEILSK